MTDYAEKMKKNREKRHRARNESRVVSAERFLKLRKYGIKKRNEKFAKASPAEKRVIIAKDILLQLASKRLQASTGIWLDAKLDVAADRQKEEAQDIILDAKSCNACALGSIFLSTLEHANKFKFNSFNYKNISQKAEIHYQQFREYLLGFFEHDQLIAIELAFERGAGWYSVADAKSIKYRDFAAGFGASERLEAIMKNIVEHNGEFVVNE